MPIDQTFERRPVDAGERSAALTRAASRLPAPALEGHQDLAVGTRKRANPNDGTGEAADNGAVPVLDALSGLLPEGLRRGETVSVASREGTPDYLTLALLAGALRAGLWCAAVGVQGFGGLALAEQLGSGQERAARLARLLMVSAPGERWAQVTAALAEGVDLLVVRPPGQVPAQLARRVDARLRQGRAGGVRHNAALVVLGAWPGARLVLRTAGTVWTGLDGVGPTAGTGQLTGGRATVVAEGRATGGRARTARLWLPTATGAVAPLTDAAPSDGSVPTGTAPPDTALPDTASPAPDDASAPSRRLSVVA